MAQKWDYKFILRYRTLNNVYLAGDWEAKDNGKPIGKVDLVVVASQLGAEGWELVSIVPRSSTAVVADKMPTGGVTTEELWVFKRPKAI